MVAQAGLFLAWSETPEDTFCRAVAHMFYCTQIITLGSNVLLDIYEPRHEKTCLQEFPTRSDSNRPAQPQKLARVLKFRLYNLDIILSKQRKTKALIRLRGCAGWSALLLFAYDIDTFSHGLAHIIVWFVDWKLMKMRCEIFLFKCNVKERVYTKQLKNCVTQDNCSEPYDAKQ